MTCIAGIQDDNGNVWIAGDRAASNYENLEIRADPKVFRNANYLIGYTSSFRMGNLLQYATLPEWDQTGDIHRFLVNEFIDACRKLFAEKGFASKTGTGQDSGGYFLVGYHGLFKIEDDFQVSRAAETYTAIGSGEPYALGSLHSTRGQQPEARLTQALEAAAAYSPFVAPPFDVLYVRHEPIKPRTRNALRTVLDRLLAPWQINPKPVEGMTRNP